MTKPICLKICEGRACQARFSSLSKERALQESAENPEVSIESCSCLGLCEKGPNIVFKQNKEETILNDMSPVQVGALFKKIRKTS